MPGIAQRRNFSSKAKLGATGTCLLISLALAGCGGVGATSGGASNNATADPAVAAGDVAAAQERIAPYTSPITEIEIDTPLNERPEPGKVVKYIRYNNATAAAYDPHIEKAAAALRWKVEIIAVDGGDPQAPSNAIIRSVSEGADYIVLQGGSISVMGEGLTAAKAANVPIFQAAGGGESTTDGVLGNSSADSNNEGTVGLIDHVIVDSGGSGSMLLVNAPDFPSLASLDTLASDHLTEHCGGCTLNKLNISPSELGGDVASQIVNALRQHPDTKYVITSFDGVAHGLPEALLAAGLDDVKVYIQNPGASFATRIESGDYEGGILTSVPMAPWLTFDQIARQSTGMDVDQANHASPNLKLWTTENMPQGETSWAVDGFEDQYKQLWKIQ